MRLKALKDFTHTHMKVKINVKKDKHFEVTKQYGKILIDKKLAKHDPVASFPKELLDQATR